MSLNNIDLPPVKAGQVNAIPSEGLVMVALSDWTLIQEAVTEARRNGLLTYEQRLQLQAMTIVEYA